MILPNSILFNDVNLLPDEEETKLKKFEITHLNFKPSKQRMKKRGAKSSITSPVRSPVNKSFKISSKVSELSSVMESK
jgi:hypothetical protein